MQTIRRFINKHKLILPLTLGFILMTALVMYAISQTANTGDDRTIALDRTPTVYEFPLTIPAYYAVNPAIEAYLLAPPINPASNNRLQPLGQYLPRVANNFPQTGVLPTPLPYPTSPPLPLPYNPSVALPTASTFNDDGTPRTLPYTPNGSDCAPAGNPVDGLLTQRFHPYHSGIDIGIPLGSAVYATHSGQITYADWSNVGYGYLVIVQSGAFITYYAHNTSFNVNVGQYVGKGSVIAWSGSTGNSSGPHVHYEVRINDVPVDPLTFESRGYGSC
ncbi:MAG: M23 family metallopeptidase [bacterium]|nr:M23 family metallopeptidase [bacterium]